MVLQVHLMSKNPYISTTRVSIANKFHKMMIYLDGLPFKVTWSFDHVILQGQVGQVTNESNYVSSTRISMAIKIDRIVTYLDRLLLIYSNDYLIMWFS